MRYKRVYHKCKIELLIIKTELSEEDICDILVVRGVLDCYGHRLGEKSRIFRHHSLIERMVKK